MGILSAGWGRGSSRSVVFLHPQPFHVSQAFETIPKGKVEGVRQAVEEGETRRGKNGKPIFFGIKAL